MNNAIAAMFGARKGGVWFVPGADKRSVQSAAKREDFTFFHIDGKSIERKEQLLNHVATALRLPKSFGHNWDALEEALIDLDDEGEGHVLFFDHIDGMLNAHPDQFDTLVEILRDAVESWKEDGMPMMVVLTGAKAPRGVARLKSEAASDE